MPTAGDPFLGPGGLPISHSPLERIGYFPNRPQSPDIDDLIDAVQQWVADFLFPAIKRYTGIDLSPFLPILNNVVDNLQLLFGFLDQDTSTFDKVAAGAYLIENVLQYTGLMATIEQIGTFITGIDAATGGVISQFFADIRYIIGDPLGLGTGTVIIGSSPFDIPILAPVADLVQQLIDGLFQALGGTGPGTVSSVVSYLTSVVGDVSGLVSDVLAFVAAVGGGNMAGAGTALAGVVSEFNDLASNLTAFLTATGEATWAALGSLISQLVTMLNQISAIFNGTVVSPVNSTVQQIQDWYNANVAYLANIPNTAVQGLTGFGTNMGNTVQSLADGVWQGLRAFLGIPSGVGPPQVSSAAQQVRVDLNNATDIASGAAAFQAKQSISKQSYLSIDPSADPVFPLAQINGASPSTVSVTQTKSVMGIIGLPDNGLKKSLVWLGGSLTGINAVYVNLYKVNISTGVFTRTHQSANIIGDLTSPPGSTMAWQFYNLPMTDFFPTLQGEWYVAELVVRGSGTYNVVGVGNAWMPSHPSVYPKALGASRTGLAFDTAVSANNASTNGLGNSGAGTLNASPISISSEATVAVMAAHVYCSAGTPAYTAKIGTTTMTLAATLSNIGGLTNNQLLIYVLFNPPTGTQTPSLAQTNAGTTWGASLVADTFKGPTGVRTAQTASGTSAAPALTCTTGQPGDLIICAIAGFQTGLSIAQNQRGVINSAGTNPVVLGDASGAASVAFSGTQSASAAYGVIALPLTVAGAPSSISSPTYDTNVPWLALAGAAGRAQHPPETVEFETAGTFTYTIPSWVIDGDYIDVVPIGAGAGGDYYGALPSPIIGGTTDPAYQYGGLAGSWNPVRLRYGDDYDIPTGTTTFSVTVGTPGAAAIANHATHTPQRGGAGGNTTVTISGYPIITAAGGAVPATSGISGKSPGNVVFQGVQYFGGSGGTSSNSGPGAATSPGAGGARGVSVHNQYQSSDFDSTPGAPGACYITAVQDI